MSNESVMMKAIAEREYKDSDELKRLVMLWLDEMHPMDRLICRHFYGLDGLRRLSVAEVSAVIKNACGTSFMGIGRIRDRISKLRTEFHKNDKSHKLYEVFVKLKALGIGGHKPETKR